MGNPQVFDFESNGVKGRASIAELGENYKDDPGYANCYWGEWETGHTLTLCSRDLELLKSKLPVFKQILSTFKFN